MTVASPPGKPLLIYDGDCGFCRYWIRRWKQMTGEKVDYLPSQDARVPAEFPEIPPEQFELSVQLVDTDGRVSSGAEAALRSLAYGADHRWPLRAYQSVPVFAKCAEWSYRLVADHRVFFWRLTRLFGGRHIEH
jgi:predicted DCC family thiol-disulfide oxidoreductase YuxK